MKIRLLALAALLAAVLAPAAVSANTQPSLLAVGVGYFDVLENDPRDEAADFRVEYRSGYSLTDYMAPYVYIRPMFGAEVTSDGGVYLPVGLVFDVPLGSRFVFSPSFAAGVFLDQGGKNMGSWLEFRSTAELADRFASEDRISVAFGHISNAEITARNPGSEILTLYYQMPVSNLFSKF